MMGTETQSVTINTSAGVPGTVRNDPGAKKVVYNMYRDMLKNYNSRANEILETKPASCLTEDRGIGDRLESMVRQTVGNQMPADYTDGIPAGGPPPPPPPPALALGAVPAVRLKSEISERRPEPPACVQNAMMTKDKKPFTYTPGGIDLSQIRSPRMARRITRNANAEGVQPADVARPAGAPQQHGPLPPSALAAMQPQLPVQVFPAGGGPVASMAPPPPPPPPPVPGPGPAPIASQPPPPPTAKAPSPPNSNSQMPYVRPDIKIPENPMGLLRKTGGPHRTQPDVSQPPPPQPVQAVQPPQPVYKPVQPPVTSPVQTPVQTPVQAIPQPVYKPVQPPVQAIPQPVYKPVQPPVASPVQTPVQTPVQAVPQPVYQVRPPVAVSPEQKHENRQQVGSIYIPPLNPEEMQKSPPTPKSVPESPGSPMGTLKKAPTPWLSGRVQQKQQEPPAWARSPPESVASSTPSTPATPGTPGSARVIPIRIERSEDQQQQMYQQQQQQRQQQQYQQQMQQQMMQQYRQQQQQFQQQQQQYQQQPTHSVRMIPIQIEGQMTHVGPMSPSSNMGTPDISGAPVQSPTFRILQRVTSRDEELHSQPAIHHPPSLGHAFPVEQMRKMQLTDEEKSLMNRVRNQVDEDCFLHDEVDPRYRGAAIPSRAFRMLQSMTDAAEASGDPTCVPRAVIVNRAAQPQGGIRKTNSPRTPDGEGALPPSEQRASEPRKYTGSAIPSRSFQMLQAMVAPENCANGSESDENNASYPYDPNMYPWGYNPMYPPPPYWNDPYWGYYADPNAYPHTDPETPADNEDETPQSVDNSTERNCETPAPMTQEEYYGQMPYWDPYYAYYAAYYGYYPPPPPHPYSPHAFYPSNETDDYSSNDEMAYYGARFPPGSAPCGHESVPPTQEQVTPTDTEVEEISSETEAQSEKKAGTLQAIKSVSDIQVYSENGNVDESSATEEEVESSESDEEDEDDDDDSDSTEDGADDSSHLPHQLSVILEESEVSDAERRRRETSVATTISEDDSSTTIGGDPCEDDSLDEQDMEEATVTVRLPLKLKFGMSENGKEGVTEVIVGDSELEHHTPDTSVSVTLNISSKSEEQQRKSPSTKQQIRSPFCRQNSEETENYETAEDTDAHDTRENSPVQSADEYEDGDTDFWEEIEKKVKSGDEADSKMNEEEVNECSEDESDAESITKVEIKDNVAEESKEKVENNEEEEEEDDDDDDEDDSSESDEISDNEETDDCKLEKDLRDAFASDAVKERVRALRETGKARIGEEPKEEAVSVRQRIMAIENGGSSTAATSASRSSSMKGCDFSEEDGDSGVTSDVSRHTDTESDSFTEQLRKRYQRASTHSRLFKLLQDECSKSDDEDEDDTNEDGDAKDIDLRRKQLSLPLSGSEPESGICSPASPTWLARELVHGLLGGRRGRKYKSLPLERLYAAAQRILQEDALSNTSEDGSPMESYASDYRSYYSSWEDAGTRCSSAMKKRIARCPRVKSEKNVPARVAEVEETGEETSPCPAAAHHSRSSRSPSVSRQQVTSAS